MNPSNKGTLGFLFPGQASQKVGMGRDLVASYPEARQIFQRADECLGMSLSGLCFDGPMEELTQTRNAQPAILTHSLAVHAALSARIELEPALVAGHSLGEISAAAAVGVLSLEDAVKLVRARGELMWEAGQKVPGTMAAVVGLAAPRIVEICAELSSRDQGVVVVANLNSPDQVVVSGDVSAVQAVAEPLKEAGARRVLPLKVSGAFHSPLLEVVQGDFAAVVGGLGWSDPVAPVVSNVSASAVDSGQGIAEGLVRQLVSPVRWHESVQAMVEAGLDRFLELGPGNVLSNLGARSFRTASFASTSDAEGVEKVLASAGMP